jgi:hypothetical protein
MQGSVNPHQRERLAQQAQVALDPTSLGREVLHQPVAERVETARDAEAEVREAEDIEAIRIHLSELDVLDTRGAQDAWDDAVGAAVPHVMDADIEPHLPPPEYGGIASGDVVLIQHQHGLASLGEQRPRGETTDPGADDDDVVSVSLQGAESLSRLRG